MGRHFLDYSTKMVPLWLQRMEVVRAITFALCLKSQWLDIPAYETLSSNCSIHLHFRSTYTDKISPSDSPYSLSALGRVSYHG